MNTELIEREASIVDGILATTVTRENMSEVADMLKALADGKKSIKDKKDLYTEPAQVIMKNAREMFDPYIKRLEEAEDYLRSQVRSIWDEDLKASNEEIKKVTALVEANEISLNEAMERIQGAKFEAKIKTENASMSSRIMSTLIIDDVSVIPPIYLMPNEKMIVEAIENGTPVEGCHLEQKTTVVVR